MNRKDHEILPYEENEAAIDQTEQDIQNAISSRNYQNAKMLQIKLDILLSDRKYWQKIRNQKDYSPELTELNFKQKKEEEDLKQEMIAKMNDYLQAAHEKYSSMKEKNQNDISKLDRKYSDPYFGLMRYSPDMKCLKRAEDFYVKNRDFHRATALKEIMAERARYEYDTETDYANRTVQSKMDQLVHRQETEMLILHDNLETQKNNMKIEIKNRLQTMNNKYSKERIKLGVVESLATVKMLPTDGSVTGIFEALDEGFAAFQKELLPQTEPQSTRLPLVTTSRSTPHNSSNNSQKVSSKTSPRASPRNSLSFGLRNSSPNFNIRSISPRSASPRASPRNSPRNWAARNSTNTIKSRSIPPQPSPPLSPQSGPNSPRNARVAKAFENSMRKTGFVQVV